VKGPRRSGAKSPLMRPLWRTGHDSRSQLKAAALHGPVRVMQWPHPALNMRMGAPTWRQVMHRRPKKLHGVFSRARLDSILKNVKQDDSNNEVQL
jgi:hypothetical protein